MQQISQQTGAAVPGSSTIVVKSMTLRSIVLRFIALRQSAIVQIFGAILLGMIMLYGVGFASIDLAHNAAHDGRHAVAFPCH